MNPNELLTSCSGGKNLLCRVVFKDCPAAVMKRGEKEGEREENEES